MKESFDEHPRPRQVEPSLRERELEVEVARLEAELETARGGDDVGATSRFLAMAADTVDLAMENARRQADDLVAEVSADAEARRDEATRLAAEAESRTEALRDEAENHEAVLIAAEQAAARIKQDAETEARTLVSTERTKVADEIEALSEVRGALEDERDALESYHEELRRRVQELAESMVSFMTTEPLLSSEVAIDSFRPAPLDAPDSASEPDPCGDAMTVWVSEPEARSAVGVAIPDPMPVESIDFEQLVEFDTEPEASPALESEPAPVRDEVEFGGITAVDETRDDAASAGLFAPATEDEIEPRRDGASLFGAHGARLIEQVSSGELASALEDDIEEDRRFRSFITGDVEVDESRDWLLRPEQS